MGVKEYLEKTPVFTIEEFKSEFPTVTGYNLLSRAVGAGKALRVSRGLYASSTGQYAGVMQDRYRIAAKLASDAVIAFHSALDLHGIAHSTTARVQYYSGTNRKALVFQGNAYERYPVYQGMEVATQIMRAQAYGEVLVSTKEQTLVDCLTHLGRGGGPEEVLRSLSGLPYVDIEEIKAITSYVSDTAVARIGWLIDQKREGWGIREGDLRYFNSRLKAKSYRFAPVANGDCGWSKKLRLILPTSESEMREWTL